MPFELIGENFNKVNLKKENTISNKVIFCILLLAFFVRILFIYYPYWGLEYEDAYIFSTVSRAINIKYDFSLDPFYTKTGTFGSFLDVQKTETISGHFIFFPILLSVINYLIGYSARNVMYVNTFLSLITIFFALKTAVLLEIKKGWLWAFGLVFITVPFLTIYNTSGLSETFSSVFVMAAVFYYFKSKAISFKNRKSVTIYVILLAAAVFIKRDNLVLMTIPVIDFVAAMYKQDRKGIRKSLAVVFAQIILIASFSLFLDINRTLLDEFKDIKASPFSIQYLLRIFPVFVSSLFKVNFFSIIGFLLCFALFLSIRRINSSMLVLIAIITGYLFTYSFHYRSYYFVNNNQSINVIDTLRYFTNFLPIICIFSFLVIGKFIDSILKNQYFLTLCVVVTVIFNVVNIVFLRKDLSDVEFKERIEPVRMTLSLMKADDIIITDRPIVFKLFCSKELFVVDVNSVGPTEQRKINEMKRSKRIFVMKDEEQDTRYDSKAQFFADNNFTFVQKLSSHYNLLELK